MISHEYIGALVIVIVSVLKATGIEIAPDAVTGLITGIVALWIAIRRFQKGDITVVGAKK
jgi:cadmium resistance protein CadD (predicted permease)